MTTLQQLPLAVVTGPADLLLLEQGAESSAVTVQTLLNGTQPALTLASGALLGRASVAPGGPEPIAVGTGLTVQSGVLAVDALSVAPLASPALTGIPTAPTAPIGDDSSTVATTAFVQANIASLNITGDAFGSGVGTVTLDLASITAPGTYSKVSVNAKGQVTSGSVLAGRDVTTALGFTPYNAANPSGYVTAASMTGLAPLASPAFTGVPTAPTPSPTDNSTMLATTAFVQGRTVAVTGDVIGSGNGTLALTLPAIATAGTYPKVTINAKGQVTAGTTLAAGDITGALGFSPYNAANPAGYVTSGALSGLAPLASPALTGTPTAPTPSPTDNSTMLATTAFVQAHASPLTVTGDVTGSGSGTLALTLPAIATAGTYPKVTINAKGQVTAGTTLAAGDVTGALGFSPYNASNPAGYVSSGALSGLAPLASPALTGTPTAPTPASADNSTKVATTAFVQGRTVTVTGDVAGSGSSALALTLPAIATAGTYPKVTINAKGQVTAGTTLASGDVTGALGFSPYNAANPAGFVAPPTLATFPAMSYGAFFDGVHDDAPGITAAIAAAAAAGGGIVLLPPGHGRLASGLVQRANNVHLVGTGVANLSHQTTTSYDACTSLTWIGAAGGTMLTVAPLQNLSSGVGISNADVRGIVLDCANLAGVGALIASVSYSTFELGYYAPLQCGVRFSTVWLAAAASATGTAEINDCQHNTVSISGYVDNTTSTTVATAVGAGGSTSVAVASVGGFIVGMQVKVGAGLYILSAITGGDLVFATTVSASDGAAGNTVAYFPRGVWLHGSTASNLPSGYTYTGGATYPQLWLGNVSMNTFVDVAMQHYCPGDAFTFGYSDHNSVRRLTMYTFANNGLVFDGCNANGGASAQNRVDECSGGILVRGTATYTTAAADSEVTWFDSLNTSSAPVIEAGATLRYRTDTGLQFTDKIIGASIYDAGWEPITGTWTKAATTSLAVVSGSSDHIHLATALGDMDWSVRINGTNGNFEVLPVANTGSILLGASNTGVGNLTASGTVSSTGLMLANFVTGTPIAIDGYAGFARMIQWASGTSVRWQFGVDGSTEAGANAGSNVVLSGWSDTGAYLGNWLTITRATGAMTVRGALSVGGTLAVAGALTGPTPTSTDSSTNAATTAWVTGKGYVQLVATVAALRALPYAALVNGASLMVNAYAIAGDGGAGLFTWNATANGADNSGTIVTPTGNAGAGRWLRQLTDGYVTPQMFGALGDGVTNDTAAFNAALAAGPVVVPRATYMVANVAVPNGAWMEGGAGLGYSGDVAASPNSSQNLAVVAPILVAVSGTTSCILNVNGTKDATLKGLFLDGGTNSPTCDGISSGSTQLMIERLTVTRCVNGLGATSTTGYTGLTDLYTHVATMLNCEFCNNTNGVTNLIDSYFTGGAVSANVTGVNLGSGANANTFSGCRYEWNSGCGVQGYSCASNVFLGGLFDRNSGPGVNLGTGCADFTFTGVNFNRNGANNAYPGNGHIELNGTSSCTFTGCISKTGLNDNGTGNLTPAYTFVFVNANAMVTTTNCDWSGYVTAFSTGTNPTAFIQRDNNGGGPNIANTAQPFMGGGRIAQTLYTKGSAQIGPGQAATFPMTQAPFTSNYSTFSRELRITAENYNTPYQQRAANFNMMWNRGTVTVLTSVSAAYGEAGATGVITWGGTGTLRLSSSAVAADGSAWTLTVTNGATADGSNWGVWAEFV